MNEADIEKEIREAYSNAEQVGRSQFDGAESRIKLQANGKESVVEMWYNKTTKNYRNGISSIRSKGENKMMNIIIDGDSVSQNKSGKIMGNIYFEVDGQFYPEKKLERFLQIVLGWWVNDFIISQKRVNKNFEFRFMGGPYKVLGQSSEANIYQVQFMRDALEKDEILLTTVTTKLELQKTLLKVCENFFRIVEQQNISHGKISGLKVLFDQLKDV